MVVQAPYQRYVLAVERVEQLLRNTCAALNAVGIEYAIIGGNAVAAWVATVDEAAARSTKDVDLLIRRADLEKVAEAVRELDLVPIEVLGVHMFVDRTNPNPKTGVHLVFAGERIRPEYAHPAPDPTQSRVFPPGFRMIDLPALVAMKLQAYRFIDRAHIQDLRSVALLDDKVRGSLPPALSERLRAIESEPS